MYAALKSLSKVASCPEGTSGCTSLQDLSDAMVLAAGAVGCCITMDGCRASACSWSEMDSDSPRMAVRLRMFACAMLGRGDQDTAEGFETRPVRSQGNVYQMKGLHLRGQGVQRSAAVTLLYRGGDGGTEPSTDARLAGVLPLMQNAVSHLMRSVSKEGDVERLERQCVSLTRALHTDMTTGLLTENAFRERVGRELDAGKDRQHALVLLDVFHLTNLLALFDRTYVGQFLKHVSVALVEALPEGAVAGQIREGELAVLVPLEHEGKAALRHALALCRGAVQSGARAMGRPDLGRVSIGVCTWPDMAATLPELFDRSRAALRAARATGRDQQGRNQSVFYEPELSARFGQGQIRDVFGQAVSHDRIRPYFQPMVDLATGACRGFEVLARWEAEDGSTLTPENFQEVFRDHRTAEALTQLMLRQGLERFAEWKARVGTAQGARLAVNLTAYDLTRPGFVGLVEGILREVGLGWEDLSLEVTETVILGDRKGQIFRSLDRLRSLGATVAMDDFGTGYGSFQHLRDWPIDTLKIDRDFVRRLGDSPRDAAVVRAILGLAQGCGMTTVVEGIETEAQLAEVRGMVDVREGVLAQGYLFAPPMAPDDLISAPGGYQPALNLRSAPNDCLA